MIAGNNKFKKTICALSGIFALTTLAQEVNAGTCRVAATKCEVADMIEKAKFSPQPGDILPITAAVKIDAIGISDFRPNFNNRATQYAGSTAYYLVINNQTDDLVTVDCYGEKNGSLYAYIGDQKISANNKKILDFSYESMTSVSVNSLSYVQTVLSKPTDIKTDEQKFYWDVSLVGTLICTISPSSRDYKEAKLMVPVQYSS